MMLPSVPPGDSTYGWGDALVAARVVRTRSLGSLREVTLSVPGWGGACAGQFAMLRLACSTRFLPRAFSVHTERPAEVGGDGARVTFLISCVGPGTAELATAPVGSVVHVIGPLGRGFDLDALALAGAAAPPVLPASPVPPPPFPRLLIAGGGVGTAPLLLVVEQLAERVGGGDACLGEVLVLLGFRDASQAAVLEVFEPAVAALAATGVRARLEAICEDGALGREGLVTELLSYELRAGDVVVACGAHAMCRAVWELGVATGDVRAWFSLEAGMACGVGSCQG
ncbi:MAG TPA: hypothetical protein VFD74_04370, partial [Thermoleophilia bacterium]|nr:hypothetical protein [Thermoleophilia bacterium]